MENYFTKNLKYIREKRGISQNKLADMINVNQTTIARWEDENRIPTIEKAIEVSNALKVPLNDLIGKDLKLSDDNNVSENDIVSIKENIKNSNSFTDNEKETLIGMINYFHSLATEKKGGENDEKHQG